MRDIPYHYQLLDQAVFLLKNKNEANLRRCSSSLYYAAFHFIMDATKYSINISISDSLIKESKRQIPHKTIKEVSQDYVKNRSSVSNSRFLKLLDSDIEDELLNFCELFIVLYEEREIADYDLSFNYETKELNLESHISELKSLFTKIEENISVNFRSFIYTLLIKDGIKKR